MTDKTEEASLTRRFLRPLSDYFLVGTVSPHPARIPFIINYKEQLLIAVRAARIFS